MELFPSYAAFTLFDSVSEKFFITDLTDSSQWMYCLDHHLLRRLFWMQFIVLLCLLIHKK